MIKKFIVISALAIMVAGCESSSEIYEIKPNTFQISSSVSIFTTADRLTDLVMKKAHAHCAVRKQKVFILNQEQSITRFGFDTTLKVYFLCQNY